MHPLKAVIFGAIGTIAETSDLQRQSFNAAFAEAGLDWHWDAGVYKDLLCINGGQNRLRVWRDTSPARSNVTDAAIAQLHSAKTRHYVNLVAAGGLQPRPGVAALIDQCLAADIKVAWCTSTSMDNVASIQKALSRQLPFERFDTVVTIDKISRVKPAPDAYVYALAQLGIQASEAVAIEDSPVSMAAAKAAGVFCVATPGAAMQNQDFSGANYQVADLSSLDVAELNALLKARPASLADGAKMPVHRVAFPV